MFSCSSTGCRPCGASNPTTDTIKVNIPGVGERDKENNAPTLPVGPKAVEDERARRETEQDRALAEQRLDQESQRRKDELVRQQKDEERRRHRAEEESRLRAEEASRFQREEAERKRLESERKRRESDRQRQEAKRRDQEVARARQAKVDAWLLSRHFQTVNSKKTKWLKSFYPLHVAVEENNTEMVELLLAAGADCNLTNSSKLTPQLLAKKLSEKPGSGSYQSVLRALS